MCVCVCVCVSVCIWGAYRCATGPLYPTPLCGAGHSSTRQCGRGKTAQGRAVRALQYGLSGTGQSGTEHIGTVHCSTEHGGTGHSGTYITFAGKHYTADMGGHLDTGHSCAGHISTGHYSAGHGGTGHSGAGHIGTGHYSTGHRDTGHSGPGVKRAVPYICRDWNCMATQASVNIHVEPFCGGGFFPPLARVLGGRLDDSFPCLQFFVVVVVS